MNIIKKINRSLGFTKNESTIVLFLIGAFILGCCIKLYLVSAHSMKRFDYAASDSTFAARSKQIDRPEDNAAGEPENASRVDTSKIPNPFGSDADDEGKVHLNSATRDQLLTLPGVGEATADLILAYRDKHGRFKSIEDLGNIHGIGRKKIERLGPYLNL